MPYLTIKSYKNMGLGELFNIVKEIKASLSLSWTRIKSPTTKTKNKYVDKRKNKKSTFALVSIDKSTNNFGDSSDKKEKGVFANSPELSSGVEKEDSLASQDIMWGGIISQENESEKEDSELKIINDRIKETSELLKQGQFQEARKKLFQIQGELSTKGNPKKETTGTYNNIGISYNLSGEDYGEAIKYFEMALSLDPSFAKAKINIALAYANRGDADDIPKSFSMAKALWDSEKTADTAQVFLWATYKKDGAKKFFEYVSKNKEDFKELFKDNSSLINLVATIYLEAEKVDESMEIVEEGLKLFPNDSKLLFSRTRAIIFKTQKENQVYRDTDIIPVFNDYEKINEAISILRSVKKTILESENENRAMLLDIDYSLCTCLMWIGEYAEALELIDSLKANTHGKIDSETNLRADILLFGYHIKKKEFEIALNILENNNFYEKIPYQEIRRLTRVFIFNGAPEQALKLLGKIEKTAEENKDVYYWFDLSVADVLLNKKNDAIRAAEKAKELSVSKETELHKMALSHLNAIYFHYTKPEDGEDSETGRLIKAMNEHQEIYPEDKVLTKIHAIEENGELTQEIKDIFLKQKAWYEDIRSKFLAQPIPTYFLEKIFKQNYSEIVCERNDPEFRIQFTQLDEAFTERLSQYFSNSNGFVFDYLSLLDLSKMDFLGHLEKVNKPIVISELLFEKIQKELLHKEIPELRRLWEFLRKSSAVKCIPASFEVNASVELGEKLKKLFDEWLISSIVFCQEKNYVFVSNDLRMLQFLDNEKISAVNTTSFVKDWESKRLIDDIMRSRALGDMAERFYTFLSFDENNLLNVVLEDKGKITLRSYHLVTQINLPGSDVMSFLGVYVRFMGKLWKTGLLSDEKVAWFSFLVRIFMEKIRGIIDDSIAGDGGNGKMPAQLSGPASFLGIMFRDAVRYGSKDDLASISEKLDDILGKDRAGNSIRASVEKLLKN